MNTIVSTKYHELILKKSIDGFQYLEEGEGDVIVLLHGLFGSLSNWENTIRHFSISHRVIVPLWSLDDASRREGSLDAIVKYVYSFIERLQLKDVSLMGNSLGGQIALKFSLRYPWLVKKLLLAGSAGLYENTGGTAFPRRGDYHCIREKVRGSFYNSTLASDKMIDEVHQMVGSISKSLGIVGFVRASQRNNLIAELPFMQVPTLIVWGLNDTIIPQEISYRFYHLIPNAQLRIIDECGHIPMIEKPDEFNALAKEFLEGSIENNVEAESYDASI